MDSKLKRLKSVAEMWCSHKFSDITREQLFDAIIILKDIHHSNDIMCHRCHKKLGLFGLFLCEDCLLINLSYMAKQVQFRTPILESEKSSSELYFDALKEIDSI